MVSRMFEFITKCWNPLGGECRYHCVYCWARKLAADRKMAKYQGESRLIESICKRFKAEDFVFVCDMLDLFGEWVSSGDIKIVLCWIAGSPAQFLLSTKNPKRYLEFFDVLPKNAFIGCTIESNRDYPELSQAPLQFERLKVMAKIAQAINGKHILPLGRTFISIEPILNFDYDIFVAVLLKIRPWAVAVGYDNYANHLPEPPLAKTMELIGALERAGITVFRKTLREAWNNA